MKKIILITLILVLMFSVNLIIGHAYTVTLDDPTEDGHIQNTTFRQNDMNWFYAGRYSGPSFLPDTKILMVDGSYRQIADIHIGEKVISFNPYTNEEHISEILRNITHKTSEYLIINGMLKITPNHNVWSDGRFKRAGELKIGDCLLDSFNRKIPIKTIEKIEIEVIVHDLSITFPHTFYAEGFLVHNPTLAYRGYVEWDISSIPDEATITDVIFKYHGQYHGDVDCHIHEMLGARPSTSTATQVWDEVGEGTVYADPAGFVVVGTNQEVDLGASADSDLQSQLTDNWFAIGIQGDNETGFANAAIYSEERGATAVPKPTLYVVYTGPDSPTNVQATDGAHIDKVVITWTKSDGATGYQVYRNDVGLGWLGDVATYDDTGADVPTITPGYTIASDGIYIEHVALSLSGQSANNGTTHTYKVRARINGLEGEDSDTDTGYRGEVGALTYQWQRSAADSDADYSNIDGATTASYNDTGAPENGDGRYYRCVENATGATQQISTSDRGNRDVVAIYNFFGYSSNP